jgi:hypothetical protein
MTGIEEHQYQVRQVDDVVGKTQRGIALRVCIKAGGVNQYAAAQFLTG